MDVVADLDETEYQLYDSADVLCGLVPSSDGDVVVRFTVEEIRLELSADGVTILSDDTDDD